MELSSQNTHGLGLSMTNKTNTNGFMKHNSQEILYKLYDNLEYQMKMSHD